MLEALADDRYMGILLLPGHQSLPVIGQITSENARVFARSMIERMDVDWTARGYGDQDFSAMLARHAEGTPVELQSEDAPVSDGLS